MNRVLFVLTFGLAPTVALAQPTITSLSVSTAARSGRVVINGSGFGATQSGGRVEIANLVAPVTRWSDTRIVAYVPEATPLGSVFVQVLTTSGASNLVPLTVTLRPAPQGRVKWRFQADAPYIQSRPVIGSDGTVYVNDVLGHLYALAPDGALRWIVNGAGGAGVTIGPDDTVYVGSEAAITAVNPSGAVRWQFIQNPRAFIFLGPSVGPDGNIYGVGTQGMGIFSLTPQGNLRWAVPESYDRPPVIFQDLVFGPASGKTQFYFHANNHIRGVELGGNVRFTYPDGLSTLTGDPQPATAPDGTLYTNLFSSSTGVQLGAFDPNGNLLWTFSLPPASSPTAPDVGPEGVVYFGQNLINLFAINPGGTRRWQYTDTGILFSPIVSPLNDLLLMGGRIDYGQAGFFQAVSTEGVFLWRENLPFENGAYIIPQSRARFTPDGLTAYIGTSIPGQNPADEYCYLYALDTGSGGSAVSLASLTLNPTSVKGGTPSQGTVSLSGPAPAGGAVVSLSSSNTAVATVPSSVLIAAGATSATFTVTTFAVTATSSVTISASYAGVTKTAVLTVIPATTDTVAIQLAEYVVSKRQLRIQATSTSSTAVLKAYVTATNQLIGTLTNKGGGKYAGQFSWPSNPQNITVRSSLGGSASKNVTVK